MHLGRGSRNPDTFTRVTAQAGVVVAGARIMEIVIREMLVMMVTEDRLLVEIQSDFS